MKVKGSLYWIYSFTSGCKGKMLVAILLAVIGVLCGMAPYFALAGILSGLIQNTLTAEHIFCYVGIAVLGETLKMLFNTVSSLKAHRAAYHILGNIRCKLAEKMMRVPMGIMVDTPSGKLKAMVVDTVDKLEQPLAHMLPEITANVFTPLCIIILLFILDWRMALACMIVIPIGFLLLMGQMKDYKNRSDRYIEASGNMDSSLVEYVNGIEVIKTFSQTGKSFQKFSDAVKNYHDTTLDWWKNTWLYSALGLTVIPATLVGGIPVAIMRGYQEMLLEFVPEDMLDQEKMMEMLRGGMLQIERMNHFIDGMRKMTKLEERELNCSVVDIRQLISQIKTLAEVMEEKSEKDFTVTAVGESETLVADAEIIMEVADNLLSNAFRYASQKVGLKLTVTAQDLKMSIGDDGTGFQENIDTVTQAFYHENSQDDLKHFGMGMYISRIYCERHGGKLLIKNAADGGAEIEAVFKNYVSEKQQQK